MPFKRMEMASNGVKSYTASRTSLSLVNSSPNPPLNINTTALKSILIARLVPLTTNTENFATLGCPAPSSLLIRTLQQFLTTRQHCFLITTNDSCVFLANKTYDKSTRAI
jgi:hypothetical protein